MVDGEGCCGPFTATASTAKDCATVACAGYTEFFRSAVVEAEERARAGQGWGKEFGSWDVESTIRLAKIVADLGVDLLDVWDDCRR